MKLDQYHDQVQHQQWMISLISSTAHFLKSLCPFNPLPATVYALSTTTKCSSRKQPPDLPAEIKMIQEPKNSKVVRRKVFVRCKPTLLARAE